MQNYLPPPVRLGTPRFSEVVPERASQSWSWNSQQYWGISDENTQVRRGCKRCFEQLERWSPESRVPQCNPVLHQCNPLWGFGEGLLKDKFASFEASKNPIPKRRKTACKTPIFISKKGLFETPFKLDRVSFSTPDLRLAALSSSCKHVFIHHPKGIAACECCFPQHRPAIVELHLVLASCIFSQILLLCCHPEFRT